MGLQSSYKCRLILINRCFGCFTIETQLHNTKQNTTRSLCSSFIYQENTIQYKSLLHLVHIYSSSSKQTNRCDTCFDAHLFLRHFCLYHVVLCTRSDDVNACFFVVVNNIVLHCQEKTNV